MSIRDWATPLTIGSFVIAGLTGILLLFHFSPGLMRPAHEWLSLLMFVGVGLHLIINWRAFKLYFSKRIPTLIIGVCVVLTALSMLPLSGGGEGEGGAGPGRVFGLLQSAPLTALAGVMKTTPDALVAKLTAKGLKVTDPNQSLKDIAAANQKSERSLIGAVLE